MDGGAEVRMNVSDKINEIIPVGCEKKIIVFGIGYIGVQALFLLLKHGKKVDYIIDSDKSKLGKEYFGVTVRSPYDLIYEDWDNILVFICAGGVRVQEMADLLEQMGGIYEKNYFKTLSEERYVPTDKIDAVLGYSRGEKNNFQEMRLEGEKRKDKEYVILALGGSTTDYSMYGIRSWPFFLKELCVRKGIAVNVINGGCCGYRSAQEMLKLIGEGLDVVRPDMVIVYSGFNDSAPSKFPLVHDHYAEVLSMLRENYIEDVGEIDEIYFGRPIVNSADNWIKHMRIMYGTCVEFGIKFFGMLQPTMVTGAYRTGEIEKAYLKEISASAIKTGIKTTSCNESLNFYEEVKRKMKKYPYLHDFTGIFDGQDDCFYDWVHCNENGNKLIAQNIFAVVFDGLKSGDENEK